jgi:putative transposase
MGYILAMRVEPFAFGSIIHAVKRGARGMQITNGQIDEERFPKILFYMNNEHVSEDWEMAVRNLPDFTEPKGWPPRKPLVKILAYTLMPNHFHILLQEIREGGISAYMQKIGQSMTNHFNTKYKQSGSIFQGSYRSKTITSDEYLRYVACYIMVKNVFELYPKGGLRGATEDFEGAWKWALSYKYSSFRGYAINEHSPIIEASILREILSDTKYFKSFARDVVAGGKWTLGQFE